jgi:uncharacterized protein
LLGDRFLPRKKKSLLIPILSVLLPLAALTMAGVALFQWHTSSRVKSAQNPRSIVDSDPDMFSKELSTALVSSLSDYGISQKDIRRTESRSGASGLRRSYTVTIPSTTSLTFLNLKVSAAARKIGGKVFSGTESADGQLLTLTLGSKTTPTDIVIFRKNPTFEVRQAKAAIIIDDVGIRSIENIRRLCNQGRTITLSILPFQPYTAQAVAFATNNEIPYILHMPMEPKSKSEIPGKGSILTTDTEAVVTEKLSRAFKSVRGAQGLNNHMGSKATEDMQVMETVMNYLKSNDYFFIDSKTSPVSTGVVVSQRVGVKSAAMTGYIDAEGNRGDIENRLVALASEAFDHGPVIIIGHDRPTTINVLEKNIPKLAQKGIRFVPASEIVK